MLHIYNPKKRHWNSGLLTFSGSIEMEQWLEMGERVTFQKPRQQFYNPPNIPIIKVLSIFN